MKINPNGFREYDARWLFEKDIDLEGITDLGKGLGSQIIKHTKKTSPRVIVGHEYRSYSEDIKKALINGLTSTGCAVEDIGLSLSPTVYFAQFNLNSDAIAMVTASHNENRSGFLGPLFFWSFWFLWLIVPTAFSIANDTFLFIFSLFYSIY